MEWADSNVRSHSPTMVNFILRVHRPSGLSATVCLEIYASFEFQAILGAGEQLGKLTSTVKQLLDYSTKRVREWDGLA